MTAGFVTSDGRTLAYRRFGSGPLLVCHPGGPGFPGATLGELGGRDEFIRLAMLENRLFFAHPEHAAELGAVFREQPPNLDALAYFNKAIAPYYDLRPELDKIRAQTLVVTGDHDFFGALAAGEIVTGRADAPGQFREEVSLFLAG